MIKKIVCIVLLISGLNLTAQSAKLEYNLKKGDRFLIEMSMKQNMAPIVEMDMGISMEMETVAVKGDSFENKAQFKYMKMDISAQGEKMVFDSTKKDEELTEDEKKLKKEIAPVLDMIMYQTFSKTGKMLSFKTEPVIPSANNLLQQNQFTTMEYPTEPVKVGSTWGVDQTMNGITVGAKYKVTKITSTAVYADIQGDIQGVADAKIGGNVQIDRSSGMIASMDLNISAGAAAMGLEMNVKMTSKKL